jgi:hypothetical protein
MKGPLAMISELLNAFIVILQLIMPFIVRIVL